MCKWLVLFFVALMCDGPPFSASPLSSPVLASLSNSLAPLSLNTPQHVYALHRVPFFHPLLQALLFLVPKSDGFSLPATSFGWIPFTALRFTSPTSSEKKEAPPREILLTPARGRLGTDPPLRTFDAPQEATVFDLEQFLATALLFGRTLPCLLDDFQGPALHNRRSPGGVPPSD